MHGGKSMEELVMEEVRDWEAARLRGGKSVEDEGGARQHRDEAHAFAGDFSGV